MVVNVANVSPLNHIAVIMDGNNRWAKKAGLKGIAGHKAGIERLRDVLKGCKKHQIDVLTVFAFSSENWQRPSQEVTGLMGLFQLYLENEAKKLRDESVRLQVIGRRDRFSSSLNKAIEKAESIASEGERSLVIAADYGGRWDVTQAVQSLAQKVLDAELKAEDVDESLLNEHLSLSHLPPLDLLIRTGGEQRISNFLLWQAAYAEFYFSDALWPDFGQSDLDKAVEAYYNRQRRFGLTSEQIVTGVGDSG